MTAAGAGQDFERFEVQPGELALDFFYIHAQIHQRRQNHIAAGPAYALEL